MIALSEPLIGADVDLRGFEYMPVDVRRLLTSETWMTSTGEEKAAAMSLWLESWHQVPAGSLPDNDRMLAHLSQSGTKWKRVRDGALRGWVKCSDGRFYHPVVCEKAIEAWGKKADYGERLARARAAKEEKRRQQQEAMAAAKANGTGIAEAAAAGPIIDAVAGPATGHKGEERRGDEKRGTSTSPDLPNGKSSEAAQSPHSGLSQVDKADEVALFARGKAVLGKDAGGLITKLLKSKAGKVPLARAVIETASTKQDPREYVSAVIRGRDPAPVNQRRDPRL
jgi:hypothetical protein